MQEVDVGVEPVTVAHVGKIAEQHVVDRLGEATGGCGYGHTEHMFVAYGGGRTEWLFLCNRRCSGGPVSRERRQLVAQPSADQTSSFVCTRSTTAVVNSVVPAEPPRSKVFTPAATASSAAS